MVASSRRSEAAALYALDGDRVVVGVHPRDVIAALPSSPPLSVAKLADLVALWDAPEDTVFEGVRRVPLGHVLEGSAVGAPVVRRWFEPDTAQDRSISPTAAPALLRGAILGAVEASLPPAGPVAATLSGGLDSTMVVAAARSRLAAGREIHAFTHVPLPDTEDPHAGWDADDGPWARLFATETAGVRLTELANTGRVPPLEACARALPRTWQPAFNPANQHWLDQAFAGAAAAGSPILLAGAAGNATFSRDRDGILRELAASGRLAALVREVGRRHGAGEPWRAAGRQVVREALPPGVLGAVRRLRGLRSRGPGAVPADEPVTLDHLALRPEALSAAARAHLAALHDPSAAGRGDWVAWAQEDSSRLGPLHQSWPGVWWSDPLSDQEVLTLALRVPEEAWLVGGHDRGLAREAARGLVPDAIRLRRTKGAQGADVGAILAGQEGAYRTLLARLRDSPVARQVLDLDRLDAAVGPLMTDPLTAQAWQAIHGRAFAVGQFIAWYEDEVL